MKRITAFALMFALIATPLTGCNRASDVETTDKISVVCTIFPQYDWVRQILGDYSDNFELTLLLNNRIDLHNYQPSVDDIVKISTCDLIIYAGGESDKWVEDALEQATNPNMRVINLLDILGDGAKTEEIIEGMEDEDDAHEDQDQDDEDDDEEYDEHVWLSLKNAMQFVLEIADALSYLEPDHSSKFEDNAFAYNALLSDLHGEYQKAVDSADTKILLFGDRFPFRYLADDYNISYYAAFPGCSAETEASFDTIIFLAEKTDELGLKAVMVTESSNRSIANAIINNTAEKDQQILTLDSMQSVTQSEVENGVTYISVMESNLAVLAQALK